MAIATRTGISLSGVATVSGIAKAGIATIDGIALGAPANIVVDMWQDFEFATLTAANLEANDHSGAGTWAVNDAGSKLSMSGTGQKVLLSTVGGVSTAGTEGMAMDYSGTVTCNIQFNPTSYGASLVSHLAAIFVPTIPSDALIEVAWSYNVVHVNVTKSGANYTATLSSSNGTSGTVSLTPNTWYYFSWTAHRNQTCSLAVFDMAGAQVGSTVTIQGSDQDYSNPLLGESNGHSAQVCTFYFDNFCIDSSTAVFPLGP